MLEIKETILADVPCYEIAEPGRTPKADVLLYHGWGSNAEKQCFRGQLLATFGYRVVVPEIPHHGARGVCDYAAAESAGIFLEVLLAAIDEGARLAASAFRSERGHFIVGHSLGGMIALGLVARLQGTLDGVCALNSTAHWQDLPALVRGVYADADGALAALETNAAQATLARLQAVDPAAWQRLNIQTPVLLTNGALDTTLPPTLNEYFCKKYGAAHIRQVVIPDAGHVVTDSALAEVVGFIETRTKAFAHDEK